MILRIFLLLAALLAGAPAVSAACAADRVDIRSDGSTASFTVELADTAEERALGLMNRPEMPPFDGMLFVYPRPQSVSFWMKNTLIPLDMLFADETGTVQSIHPEATPMSTESIPGGRGIKLVLEINGGMAAALGLTPGAELRHPAVDQDVAAWPCDAD